MKKYLMTGVAAIAICAAFTSCSNSGDELYNPDAIQQNEAAQIVEKYNQAFLKYIGANSAADIPANQTWGFGGYDATVKVRTRGDSDCGTCYKKDMQYDTPSFPKTGHPAAISDSERDYVKWWFENNPGLTEEGLDIHNFYLQHVWGEANKEYNVDYDRGDDYIDRATMDYCEVGDGTNYTHILDFNSNSGGTFGIVYMRGSSALSFGYHATWGDNRNYHNFKLAHIVGTADDGTQIDGWYVGLAMYSQKDDNGVRTLNKDHMTYADDWILKIVPDEPIVENDPDNVCIMAEDLSADGDTDFDWNDVVFTVEYTSNSTAKVTLYAAGGTLPLTVAGTEVHGAFGDSYSQPNEKGLYPMINTGAKANVNNLEPVVLFNSLPVEKSKRGNDITIKVDKGKKNEQGEWVSNWIELTATGGKPAAKVCVGFDFATGHKWCEERQSIKTVYPKFSEWALEKPSIVWWR